jgi:hypothetical protein
LLTHPRENPLKCCAERIRKDTFYKADAPVALPTVKIYKRRKIDKNEAAHPKGIDVKAVKTCN